MDSIRRPLVRAACWKRDQCSECESENANDYRERVTQITSLSLRRLPRPINARLISLQSARAVCTLIMNTIILNFTEPPSAVYFSE